MTEDPLYHVGLQLLEGNFWQYHESRMDNLEVMEASILHGGHRVRWKIGVLVGLREARERLERAVCDLPEQYDLGVVRDHLGAWDIPLVNLAAVKDQ